MKLETIVIGVDFSEAADAAAQWTARYFAPDGDVRLVHVLDTDHPPRFLAGRYPSPERLFEGLRESVEKRLGDLAATLVSGGRLAHGSKPRCAAAGLLTGSSRPRVGRARTSSPLASTASGLGYGVSWGAPPSGWFASRRFRFSSPG